MNKKAQNMAYRCICVIFLAFISLSSLHGATGMQCEWGHEPSVLDSIVNVKSCPTIFGDQNDVYCCKDGSRFYCCDSAQFVTSSVDRLVPIVTGVVAVSLLIICCLCCFCCPCCLLYKRRHRGTVYGNVLQPGVQTVVATPQPVQQQVPVYPFQPTPMPMPQTAAYPVYPPQAGHQPPPYSVATGNEMYSKQAPYNPNFQ